MKAKLLLSCLVVAGVAATAPGHAQSASSGQPIPRFVTLNADEVNMRSGPGVRYPVEWVYQRRYMPLEVIAEHDTWRKVRDVEGTEGWIHRAMLSSRRGIVVSAEEIIMRREPDDDAPVTARLATGMVAVVEKCDSAWCEVRTAGFEGWIARKDIWGLYDSEVLN